MEPGEHYRHTQIGYAAIVTVGLVVALSVWLYFQLGGPTGATWPMLFVGLFFLVLLVLLCTQTVVVRDEEVEIRFGPGLIRKRYQLRKFTSVKVVRNWWWYGFGIQCIVRGWLYSVGGLHAVELRKEDGKVVRIGTDELEALEAALRKAIAALNAHVDAEG